MVLTDTTVWCEHSHPCHTIHLLPRLSSRDADVSVSFRTSDPDGDAPEDLMGRRYAHPSRNLCCGFRLLRE